MRGRRFLGRRCEGWRWEGEIEHDAVDGKVGVDTELVSYTREVEGGGVSNIAISKRRYTPWQD